MEKVWTEKGKFPLFFNEKLTQERAQNMMCVFSAASPPKKHTLVLFEAAGGGLKKNILFRTRYSGQHF